MNLTMKHHTMTAYQLESIVRSLYASCDVKNYAIILTPAQESDMLREDRGLVNLSGRFLLDGEPTVHLYMAAKATGLMICPEANVEGIINSLS